MKQLITIFKNLGTIVILLFQIAYVATIDYMRPYDKPKPKQSDTKNKTTYDITYSMKDEQDESIERSHKKIDTINETI